MSPGSLVSTRSAGGSQQADVRVDNIGRTGFARATHGSAAILGTESFDTHPRQQARRLACLRPSRRTWPTAAALARSGRTLPLERTQLGAADTVTTINGDQRTSVEYRLDATSERGAQAEPRGGLVEFGLSDGTAFGLPCIQAAPSSSFLSRSAAASVSHAGTVVPRRAGAWRCLHPASGGIVTGSNLPPRHAAATVNFTRTPRNPLPPPKAPRKPYNEQVTSWFPPRRRHATAATATGSARPSIWNQA